MKKAKQNYGKAPFLLSSCVGAATSVAMSLLVAALASVFIINEYIELNASTYIVIIGQFISVFAGVLIAGKSAGENKLFACCGAGVIYYLLFMGAGLLLYDGIGGFALQGLLACVGGCIAAILVCFRAKSHVARKKNRRRSR